MTEYAIFLAQARENIEKDKEKLEKIKKENKKIVSISIIENTPVLDSIKASVSGSSPASNLEPNFMIEVKVDEKTDLKSIRKKLEEVTQNVVNTEPYHYVE